MKRMIKGWYSVEIIKTRLSKYGLFLYGHHGNWFLHFSDSLHDNTESLTCFIREQRDLKENESKRFNPCGLMGNGLLPPEMTPDKI